MIGTNGDVLVGADGPTDNKLPENWNSVYELSVGLASRIEEQCKLTGEQFDKLVVLPRGAYYPANIVARELGFEAPELIHFGVKSYKAGTTERIGRFEYGQVPRPEEVEGLDLLIIEEVCDTGHTLSHVSDLLTLAGAGLVRTGVLHYKPGQSETGFTPDWFMVKTEAWIDYPWEKNERKGATSVVRRKREEAPAVSNKASGF
jgi:hypoxanthine phosphoribosyltransferase